MVELREDPNITLDRRQRDQDQAKRQKTLRAQLPPDTRATFSENGEMTIITDASPDAATGSMTVENASATAINTEAPTVESNLQTTATTAQPAREPPPDPGVAMRNVRFATVGLIVVVLFVLWLRQRR